MFFKKIIKNQIYDFHNMFIVFTFTNIFYKVRSEFYFAIKY
jgi:hypothetical protein